MTSSYLVTDETIRAMTKSLEVVPSDQLGSNRARHSAYASIGVVLGNLVLDYEALKRELIRRRLFGLAIGAASLVATVHQAAAGDMEHITGDLIHDALKTAAILAVMLFAGIGFFAFVWLLRRVSAALAKS